MTSPASQFGHLITPSSPQDKRTKVVGSTGKGETLWTLWEQITGQSLPRIPGLKIALQIGHPQMAALLKQLSQYDTQLGQTPLKLTRYREWLERITSQTPG